MGDIRDDSGVNVRVMKGNTESLDYGSFVDLDFQC